MPTAHPYPSRPNGSPSRHRIPLYLLWVCALAAFINLTFVHTETKRLRASRRIMTNLLQEDEYPRVIIPGRQMSDYDLHRTVRIQVDKEYYTPAVYEDTSAASTEDEDCVPMVEWQTLSFPTCNTVHENGLKRRNVRFLASGSLRDVWRVNSVSGDEEDLMVLKTLRTHKMNGEPMNPTPELFEMHRVDALAMERLTSSPYVVDVYGFCGNSVLNEFAKSTDSLFQNTKYSTESKLNLAKDAATALAEVHDIDGQPFVKIAHGDMSYNNFVFSKDFTQLKINDFNKSFFLKWNVRSNRPCGFSMPRCGKWHSFEECRGELLSEKTDINALGHVFYFIVTGRPPYEHPYVVPWNELREKLMTGEIPRMKTEFKASNDPSLQAIIEGMEMCYVDDPSERPSAREIADVLTERIEDVERRDP